MAKNSQNPAVRSQQYRCVHGLADVVDVKNGVRRRRIFLVNEWRRSPSLPIHSEMCPVTRTQGSQHSRRALPVLCPAPELRYGRRAFDNCAIHHFYSTLGKLPPFWEATPWTGGISRDFDGVGGRKWPLRPASIDRRTIAISGLKNW